MAEIPTSVIAAIGIDKSARTPSTLSVSMGVGQSR
jgi:hypothetical protein